MGGITIDKEYDANRLRCPRNHSSVGPTNNHWHCCECARSPDPDAEPEFDKVRDAKTGYEYTRDEVELNFEISGVYYA